jgi:hypothetical protein
LESIVSSGAVPDVSLIPPDDVIVRGLGSALVFCGVVATLSTGAAAKVGVIIAAAAAAESMRARLFKSNLF